MTDIPRPKRRTLREHNRGMEQLAERWAEIDRAEMRRRMEEFTSDWETMPNLSDEGDPMTEKQKPPSDDQTAIRNYPYELVIRFTHEAPLPESTIEQIWSCNRAPRGEDMTLSLAELMRHLYAIGADITQVHVQIAPDQLQRVKDRRQFKSRQ